MYHLLKNTNTNLNLFSRFSRSQSAALMFVAVFAVIGTIVLIRPKAATGSLTLIPAKQSAVVGNNFDVEVRLNPGATGVDGVEAYLNYDASKLQFVSIDGTGSPFEVALGAQTGGNGTVKIIRGSLDGDVTTTSLVAKVRFTAIAATTSTAIGLSGNATNDGAYTNPLTTGSEIIVLASNIGNLYQTPSNVQATQNQNFTVDVRLRPDTTVNGVEVELTYDPAKMQFVSIDGSASPFNVELGAQTGGNGKVKLIRGNLSGGVSSDALVAKVTFKALTGSGTSTIQTAGNATKDGYYTHPTTQNSTVSFKVPDSIAPTVSITKPTSGTTLVNIVTADISASDNVGVTKVELYTVGGALIGSDTTSPYNISIDTTKLSNGTHSLQAKAYDAAGNVGTSTTISVTVKNWPEDINQDSVVNLLDFSLLATKYGQTGSDLGREDINKDGTVNILDFSLLSAKFGQ